MEVGGGCGLVGLVCALAMNSCHSLNQVVMDVGVVMDYVLYVCCFVCMCVVCVLLWMYVCCFGCMCVVFVLLWMYAWM